MSDTSSDDTSLEPMGSLLEATSLNNRGLGHLAAGESKLALDCFQQTLTLLRDNTEILLDFQMRKGGNDENRGEQLDPVWAPMSIPGFPSENTAYGQAFQPRLLPRTLASRISS